MVKLYLIVYIPPKMKAIIVPFYFYYFSFYIFWLQNLVSFYQKKKERKDSAYLKHRPMKMWPFFLFDYSNYIEIRDIIWTQLEIEFFLEMKMQLVLYLTFSRMKNQFCFFPKILSCLRLEVRKQPKESCLVSQKWQRGTLPCMNIIFFTIFFPPAAYVLTFINFQICQLMIR